ncbi:hypothetical protein E2542_SST27780 [Spatholobus suberectus]|nr:hypothetical protein E2542_SST27780 [Spatholobus suberectus]
MADPWAQPISLIQKRGLGRCWADPPSSKTQLRALRGKKQPLQGERGNSRRNGTVVTGGAAEVRFWLEKGRWFAEACGNGAVVGFRGGARRDGEVMVCRSVVTVDV